MLQFQTTSTSFITCNPITSSKENEIRTVLMGNTPEAVIMKTLRILALQPETLIDIEDGVVSIGSSYAIFTNYPAALQFIKDNCISTKDTTPKQFSTYNPYPVDVLEAYSLHNY